MRPVHDERGPVVRVGCIDLNKNSPWHASQILQHVLSPSSGVCGLLKSEIPCKLGGNTDISRRRVKLQISFFTSLTRKLKMYPSSAGANKRKCPLLRLSCSMSHLPPTSL